MPIKKKFKKVYASEFTFKNGEAIWPKHAVSYTTKTQYLFRINRRVLNPSDHKEVNKSVAERPEHILFENMIFIGDGHTDIPCFTIVKSAGGLSIAVYNPNIENEKKARDAKEKAEKYFKDNWVNCVADATYTNGSKLD